MIKIRKGTEVWPLWFDNRTAKILDKRILNRNFEVQGSPQQAIRSELPTITNEPLTNFLFIPNLMCHATDMYSGFFVREIDIAYL